MKSPGISRREFIGTASAAVTLTAIPAPLRSASREPGNTAASSTASTVRISSAANPILFDPDQALGVHKLYPAACDLQDAAGHTLITAYSVERPDGNWSLMLINKDQSNPHQVRIAFDDAAHKSFSGPVTTITFGSDQYMWRSDGPNGHPEPNEPPVTNTLPAGTQLITLPKASVTILRAKVRS